ncbi:hypothetical protein ABBQ38_012642 [Trebouxia sp. C0009 RCD-2024]
MSTMIHTYRRCPHLHCQWADRNKGTRWSPNLSRFCSTNSLGSLVYDKYGPPTRVLTLQQAGLPALQPHQVLVDFLAAPINPSDITQIEGRYPIKPPLPAVAGNEGVARIMQRGSEVQLKKGSMVVPLLAGAGTWRQSAIFDAADLHVIPDDISIEQAATMSINPPTALRMLEEFVTLEKGDIVVQNGANSAVGQLVIQLAKAKGIHTVNVVRDRPDMEEVEHYLKSLGADVVTTDDNLKAALASAGLPRPKLGLNCVGGASSTAVAKSLAHGATIVTYGGMSMKPVTIPTSLLIFKDLTCKGFWLSGGAKGNDHASKKAVLNKLVPLLRQNALSTRLNPISFRRYKEAFEGPKTQSGEKYLLTFD